MKKTVLINIFFGEFPWYMNLFLKSCSSNPDFSFFIFTDNESTSTVKNVRFIPFTLEQFNNIASKKLNFTVNVRAPYKLCDFKPAYGLIFSEYIQDFDYWGCTDLDLVFGNIGAFMTEQLLSAFHVVCVRHDYPTGPFMIFKNIDYINSLFTKSKDYKKVFQSSKHFCFDECNFQHSYLEAGGNILDAATEIESFHHVLTKEQLNSNLKVHFDFLIIEGLPGRLYWSEGILTYRDQFEVLFYHLIIYKVSKYTLKPDWESVPNRFYIDKYIIRKDNFTSLIRKMWQNLIVYIYKTIHNFDKILSADIFKIKFTHTISGDFVLGNQHVIIRENEIIADHTRVTRTYRSLLFKNSFYIGNLDKTRYRFLNSECLGKTDYDGFIFKMIRAE